MKADWDLAMERAKDQFRDCHPMNQWLPIDSAPKDREILAFGVTPGSMGYADDRTGAEFVCWQPNDKRWRRTRSGYMDSFRATHWYNLPEPKL